MAKMMRDIVQIQGGFKPSVQLPRDFYDEESNRHFVETYIPTEEILDIFMHVRDSLQPNSENRAKLFTGTYGTGKSDLMLMIANYVTRSSSDSLLAPFFERLRSLNNAKAEMIYDARLGKPPFLLVLLQADTASTFSSFIMDGLEKALTQAGQEDVLGTTYYRAARDLVRSWESKHPDNIERFEEELQESYRMTLLQLKHDLAGPHADKALGIFSDVTARAIGMPFHPTAVIERPHEAFEMTAKTLVERGIYSGVFVIADEFTHLLKKLAETAAASPDIKAIDNLAEIAARSSKHQIHFYVVSLEGFSSALASTRTSQVALERTGGRFIQGQEELRSQYMEELISASIAKKVSLQALFADVPAQRDELLTAAMQLWGKRATGRHDREWLQKIVVEGCFPLHPLAAYCLPLLNRQLAQNERTMFSFIWDEKCGLKSFIEQASLITHDGWLNLLSLDYLFPYFEVNIKERHYELYLLYQQAKSKLLPAQVDSGLEGRLLRTLVLLDITSGDSNLRTDSELLRHALGLSPTQLPDLLTALNQLERAGIAYPSQSGYYHLVKQGQANPRELRSIIERRAQEITISPIGLLNEEYKPADINATNYNKVKGTERKLTASFVSVNGLASPASLQTRLQKIDGLLWYVVAFSEEERLYARSVAAQLTKQHEQLVVAVPHTPSDLIERFKCKLSLENLRKSSDYQRPDYQEFLADNGIVGRDYQSAFQRERQKFDNSQNLEWYFNGQVTAVQNHLQAEELATRVMRIVYSATPGHKTAQHLAKSSRSAPKLREALDQILSAPFRRSGRKSPTDAILLDGAGELGLIYFTGQDGGYRIYDVCPPHSSQCHDSRVVWSMFDERLRNPSVSLSEIMEELLLPPFGLSPQVIELFLAAFLRYNRDFVEVYTTKNMLSPQVDATGETIVKMVESPKDYAVFYTPFSGLQKEFLHALEHILLAKTEFRSSRDEAASLRNRAAKLLRQRIKDVSFISQRPSLNDLAEVLSGSPQEVLTACMQLIEIGQLPDEALSAARLLDVLPISLGLSADNTKWTSNELQQALSLAESAYSTFRQLPRQFRQLVVLQIGQCFGVNELPKNENEILKAAERWRKEQVASVRIGGLAGKQDAQDLLKLLDDDPYSFEQVFLNALPSRWKLHIFEEWQNLGTRKVYLDRLEKAKLDIEAQTQRESATVYEGQEITDRPINLSTSRFRPEGKQLTSSATSDATFKEEVYPTDSRISASRAVSPSARVAEAGSPLIESFRAVHPPTAEPTSKHQTERNASDAGTEAEKDLTSASVEQAFRTIKSIIDGLASREQRKLWTMLVEGYDPQ